MALKSKKQLPKASNSSPLWTMLDSSEQVVRRIRNSSVSYDQKHPMILRGSHPLTKFMVRSEHTRLLHAGPALTYTSLSRKSHIIGGLKVVRTVTRQCVTCGQKRSSFCHNYYYSDNGSNFVGANNEIRQLYSFLNQHDNKKAISEHCSHPVEVHSRAFTQFWRPVGSCGQKHEVTPPEDHGNSQDDL